MSSINKNFFHSPWSQGFCSLAWLALLSWLYVRDWNPMSLHPLSLLARELPLLTDDIRASVLKIWSDGMGELALLLVLAAAALGCGSYVLSRFKLALGSARHLTLSMALGLWILAYYGLALGLAGLYTNSGRLISWVLLGACSLYGTRVAWVALQSIKQGARVTLPRLAGAALFGSIAAFLLAKALRPAIFYDAITYHLGVPNYHLLEGRITYIPHDAFSNFPYTAEMLYTLGMFLAGLKLAQYTSVLIFCCAALTLYTFCTTFVEELNPVIPVAFFLATPAFLEVSILYTNDLHLAYYTLITAYCFLLWERQQRAGYLILTGVCAGICLSIKYLALITIPLLVLTGIWWVTLRQNRAGLRQCLQQSLIAALPALLVFLPWLVKNLLYTGNPFYPAFYGLFGGRNMTADQYANIAQMSHPPALREMLTGLWQHPAKIFLAAGDVVKNYGGEWNIGPLILVAVPLLLLVRNIPPVIKKLCVAAAVLFLAWNCTFAIGRFLYPCMVLLLIIAAYALQRISGCMPLCCRIFFVPAMLLLTLSGSLIGMYQVNHATKTYGMDFLNEPDEKYLLKQMLDNRAAVLESLPVYTYLNAHTDPDAVVLIIGDTQHLYIQRRHRYAFLSATTPYDVIRDRYPRFDQIARALKQDGITHIVFAPHEMQRLQKCDGISFKEKDTMRIESFLQSTHVRQLYAYRRANIGVYLYELL